jgi:hypothetical protein
MRIPGWVSFGFGKDRKEKEKAYLCCDFDTASETGDIVSSSYCVVVEDEGGCIMKPVCQLVEECYGCCIASIHAASYHLQSNIPFKPVPSSETVKCPVSEPASCNFPCSCFVALDAVDFVVEE